MCILSFVIPSENFPFILCSNRDEYLDRPTKVGAVHSFGNLGKPVFCGIDLEFGGTWLALEGDLGRVAIILNYDEFRHPSYIGDDNSKNDKIYLSRGLLVNQFIGSDESITSEIFVKSINGDLYRGFNLVIGDNTGYYFVSNFCSESPKALLPGVLYGVSNGQLNEWPKVQICKENVGKIITRYFGIREISGDSNQLHDSLNDDKLTELLESLLTVMSDSTPLPDPDFGNHSDQYCQLAAIFVNPMILPDEPTLPSLPPDDEAISSTSNNNNNSINELAWDGIVTNNKSDTSLLSKMKLDENSGCSSSYNRLYGTRTTTIAVSTGNGKEAKLNILDRNLDVTTGKWNTIRHIMPFHLGVS